MGPEEVPALPLLFDVGEVDGEHGGTVDVGTRREDVPCVAGGGSLREKAGRNDLISKLSHLGCTEDLWRSGKALLTATNAPYPYCSPG